MKICPDCAEEVQDAAKVCKQCGYRFDQRTFRQPLNEWQMIALIVGIGAIIYVAVVVANSQ